MSFDTGQQPSAVSEAYASVRETTGSWHAGQMHRHWVPIHEKECADTAVPVRISKKFRRHGREPAATRSMSPGATLPSYPVPHPRVPDSLGASLLWPRLWGTVVSSRPSHRHSRPRARSTACVCPCDGARARLGTDPGVSTWRQDGLVRGGGTRQGAAQPAMSQVGPEIRRCPSSALLLRHHFRWFGHELRCEHVPLAHRLHQ